MTRARLGARHLYVRSVLRSSLLAALASLALAAPERAIAQTLEAGVPYTVSGGFLAPTGLAVDEANARVLIAT